MAWKGTKSLEEESSMIIFDISLQFCKITVHNNHEN